MDASLDFANVSDNATDAATMAPHALLSPPAPSAPPPCDDFYPGGHCLSEMLSNEERFLAIMIIILACAVCALIVLVMVMAALIHKLSALWIKSLTRPMQTEPEPAAVAAPARAAYAAQRARRYSRRRARPSR